MAQLHVNTYPRSTRAFTLVEVMMAATIMVVGFMGMIRAFTMGSEMMATARRQTLAAQILTHELEKLRLVPWTNGSTGINDLAVASTSVTIDTSFSSAITASGATYALRRSVTRNYPVTGIHEITFTVTWTTKRSGFALAKTYTRMMSAYYGNNGLNLSYQRS
jgi:Tfp pilus assembly protein PilV